jgi:hypothetical protein
LRIAAIVDLGHDLVAEIERFAGDDRLFGDDGELYELRGSRRFVRRLAQFGDLIDLPNGGLSLGALEGDAGGQQRRDAQAAPETVVFGALRRTASLMVSL